MKDDRGSAALLAILVLISLVGLIGYMTNRLTGMSAAMGNAYKGKEGARYIAEAGIQNVVWAVSRCNLVPGFANIPFGNGTYTVNATYHPDNTMTINSTGVSGEAKETIQKRMKRMSSLGTTDIFGANDTFIATGTPTLNYNLLPYFRQDRNNDRTLLYFNLSAIPSTATIQSATLALYLYSSAKIDAVRIYRVTSQWIDSEATWNQRLNGVSWVNTKGGGDWDKNIQFLMVTDIPGWKTTDITSLVQSWVNVTYPNYGVILTTNTGLDEFYSSEYAVDPSLAPKLTVSWIC